MAADKKILKEKTNLSLNKVRIKQPAMKFAAELGWSLSELAERALEAVLEQHGRIKPLAAPGKPLLQPDAITRER